MATTPADIVEIEMSPLRMLGMLVLGVVMTIGCAAIALRWIRDVTPGSFMEFVGYAGTLFFGLCTCVALWRILTARGPVVTITPEGIRDTRVAAEFIPWRGVLGISTWQHRGQKVMVLAVDPTIESELTLTKIAKWSRGPNRALGINGLCVTAQGLTIGYDALLRTCLQHVPRDLVQQDTALILAQKHNFGLITARRRSHRPTAHQSRPR